LPNATIAALAVRGIGDVGRDLRRLGEQEELLVQKGLRRLDAPRLRVLRRLQTDLVALLVRLVLPHPYAPDERSDRTDDGHELEPLIESGSHRFPYSTVLRAPCSSRLGRAAGTWSRRASFGSLRNPTAGAGRIAPALRIAGSEGTRSPRSVRGGAAGHFGGGSAALGFGV
jgi:hypothetical protein